MSAPIIYGLEKQPKKRRGTKRNFAQKILQPQCPQCDRQNFNIVTDPKKYMSKTKYVGDENSSFYDYSPDKSDFEPMNVCWVMEDVRNPYTGCPRIVNNLTDAEYLEYSRKSVEHRRIYDAKGRPWSIRRRFFKSTPRQQ